jgi:hypothetical protein
MTRETKVGLVVASSFLGLVGIVLVSRLREGPPVQAQSAGADPGRVTLATGTKPAAAPVNKQSLPVKNPEAAKAGDGSTKPPRPKSSDPDSKLARAAASYPSKASSFDPASLVPSTQLTEVPAPATNRVDNHDSSGQPRSLPPGKRKPPADRKQEASHREPFVPVPQVAPSTDPGTQGSSGDPVKDALQAQTQLAQGATGSATGTVELVGDKMPQAPAAQLPAAPMPVGNSQKEAKEGDPSGLLPPPTPIAKAGDTSKQTPAKVTSVAVVPTTDSAAGPAIVPPATNSDPTPVAPVDRTVIVEDGSHSGAGPKKETLEKIMATVKESGPVADKSVNAPAASDPKAKTSAPAAVDPVPAPTSVGKDTAAPARVPVVIGAPVSKSEDTTPRPLPPVGTPVLVATPAVPVPMAPAAPRSAAPAVAEVTDFDLDTVKAGPGDTFANLSEQHYQSRNYEVALLRFNREHPSMVDVPELRQERPNLQGLQVLIPDRKVLEQRYPNLIPGYQPPASPVAGPVVSRIAPVAPAAGPEGTPAAPSRVILASATAAAPPTYRVQAQGERLYDIARKTLSNPERWHEIYHLNPGVDPTLPVPPGTELRLPASTGDSIR